MKIILNKTKEKLNLVTFASWANINEKTRQIFTPIFIIKDNELLDNDFTLDYGYTANDACGESIDGEYWEVLNGDIFEAIKIVEEDEITYLKKLVQDPAKQINYIKKHSSSKMINLADNLKEIRKLINIMQDELKKGEQLVFTFEQE